jgi:hypothetical protein
MRGSRRTTRISLTVVVIAALVVPARAAETFRDEAMIKCVEGGGLYYDDGHCEGGAAGEPPPAKAESDVPKSDPGVQYGDQGEDARATADADAAARKDCRDKGGRYRSDGTCQLSRDPLTRCEDAGGLFMVEGECYRPMR